MNASVKTSALAMGDRIVSGTVPCLPYGFLGARFLDELTQIDTRPLAQNAVDERSGKTEPFEVPRRRLIGKAGFGAAQPVVGRCDAFAFRFGDRNDAIPRLLTVDPAFDEFSDQARITDRPSPALDVEQRVQTIIEQSVALARRNGVADGVIGESFALQFGRELRRGETALR